MGILAVASIIAHAFATTKSAQSDVLPNSRYDNALENLSSTACSAWAEANNYSSFGQLPKFLFIGGASIINFTSTSACGTCWFLENLDSNTAIPVLIIDTATNGFEISEDAIHFVTNGAGEHFTVTGFEVNVGSCNVLI